MTFEVPKEVPEILSPICDFIFKLLFGGQKNKRILIDFLKSVLDIPDDEFEDLSFPNPIVNKEFSDGKLSTLDVLVKTKSGQHINIEIQLKTHEAFTDRIAAYNDLVFVQTIRAGQKYTGLKRTISIVIVDFDLFEGSEDYRHDFCWSELRTSLVLTKKQEIHTLELVKLPKNPDNAELCDWLTFLKANTKEEFDMIAQRNAVINEAYGELRRISADEEARLLYNRWLIDRFDEQQREFDAVHRNSVEIARASLVKNLPIDLISDITNLPISEIEALRI
ncbi:hypothetical protein FACS1894120_4710 [Clostridia bacterium]|nr:hypothetical protein FACS1894120_4710 [Clostridia bacterium]